MSGSPPTAGSSGPSGSSAAGGAPPPDMNPWDLLGKQIPGMPPPLTGEMPIMNSTQLALIVVPTVLYAVATLVVASRFYSRRVKRQSFGLDDALCLLALILGYVQHATILILVLGGGVALPLFSLSLPTIQELFKAVVANYVVYIANVAILQLAVLLFYVRMFGIQKPFRIACYTLVGVVVAWGIIGICTRIFACGSEVETAVFFIDTALPGTCINETASCAATAVLHVIFDVSVIVLPIPMVWSLQMSKFNKAVITLVLCTGVFATVCAILRMECLINLYTENPLDVTQVLGLSLLYQSLETPIGLICICTPTLAPLWTKLTESRLGSYAKRLLSRSSKSTGGYTSESAVSKEHSDKKFMRLENSKYSYPDSKDEDNIPLHNVRGNNSGPDTRRMMSRNGEIKVVSHWDVERT